MPVQELLPLTRKELRDLFHVLVATSRQANDDVFVVVEGLREADTLPDGV
jgi:hypothetical protein